MSLEIFTFCLSPCTNLHMQLMEKALVHILWKVAERMCCCHNNHRELLYLCDKLCDIFIEAVYHPRICQNPEQVGNANERCMAKDLFMKYNILYTILFSIVKQLNIIRSPPWYVFLNRKFTSISIHKCTFQIWIFGSKVKTYV